MHDFVPLRECSFFVPQSMQNASNNATCRKFEVHDFVPLLARIIKNVNQSHESPLFTEIYCLRCIVLFRFDMFLFCSAILSVVHNTEASRCTDLFRFGFDSPQKGNI